MKKYVWIVMSAWALSPGTSWGEDSLWGIEDAYCTMFGTCDGNNETAPPPQANPQEPSSPAGGDGGSVWGSGEGNVWGSGGDQGNGGGGNVWGTGSE